MVKTIRELPFPQWSLYDFYHTIIKDLFLYNRKSSANHIFHAICRAHNFKIEIISIQQKRLLLPI